MTDKSNMRDAARERYVAAIEISSSKIIGAVGVTRGQGELKVLAVEQERGVECVRYGRIQNVEEAYLRLQRILYRLEGRPSVNPRRISAVYVGLAGRSLRNIAVKADLSLPEEMVIDNRIVEDLRAKALRSSIDSSLEIVDAVPRIFHITNSAMKNGEIKQPVGVLGKDIEGTYDLIACSPLLKRNIERVVNDKLGIDIKGFVVTPLAMSHLILSDDERRLGCMLVDMGAETTTVAIFSQGNLRYLATLPLGSRNITRDLTTLNMLEESAEDIKVSSGNAIHDDHKSNVNINGLKLMDVSNLVVARAEEIVANINEQINYAGMTDEALPGGIIAVGGGFKLNGMTELLERMSNLHVRIGRLPAYVDMEDTKAPTLESLQVVSVLYAAATLDTDTGCLTMPPREELPDNGEEPDDDEPRDKPEKDRDTGPKGPTTADKIRSFLKGLFDPGNESKGNPEF